tara:strand:- start:226 stop:342 length:117 start_codon:yes stop_codon:yes gene_type:complete
MFSRIRRIAAIAAIALLAVTFTQQNAQAQTQLQLPAVL